ncbi:MAG: hypothetical protein LBB61_08320 [Treponema sp.]|jgi:hypothetical protein|nr:hypothetical protein [Treponema sp.]
MKDIATPARGFNTWYNNSVTCHVKMPEAIAINLAFKFFNAPKILREPLIGRFGEDDEVIHPGPRSYDGSYTELTLYQSGHEILIQSAVVKGCQYILVTPIKGVAKPVQVLVSLAILWNRSGYTKLEDGHLLAVTPETVLEVHTDGKRVKQMNTWLTNPYIALELSVPVVISTDVIINTFDCKVLMERQKKALLEQIAKYGDLAEVFNAMRTCQAWNTIYEPEKARVCTPVSRLWNINWGGYVIFDWDTYFAGILAAAGMDGLDDRNLAYSNPITITHEKTESGFIPNYAASDNYKSRDRSQPPVGSFAVREIYRKYRDKTLVEYLFDDLLDWNRWFAAHRRLENGQLCWGSDPFTPVAGGFWEITHVGDTIGGSLESGMDNSPLYDGIPFDNEKHIMCLADVGLTGMYIMDCEALAVLAELIGRNESKELLERGSLSKKGLEEMWDEDFGFYLNKRTDTGEMSKRIGPTNFFAFFSDKVSSDHAERMIREHFFNPDEFYGEWMIPAIARNDSGYHDQDYWRGRIWPPHNYLLYAAFRQAEKNGCTSVIKARKILAEKSKALLLKEWLEKGHVHENYNGDTGEGCDVRNSDKFLTWGGLLALVALIDAGFVECPEKDI